MKVEPSSPIQNTNLFSQYSSGSSLHPGHHSSISSHGMYLNNNSICKRVVKLSLFIFMYLLNLKI